MSQVIYLADELQYLLILTLVHCAVPPPAGSSTAFSDACINSARATLDTHQLCMAYVGTKGNQLLSSYLNWVILFSPFISFVVLFCHVIETGNAEDLTRMGSFVGSIESLELGSGQIANHHRLFEVLYQVSKRYSELKATTTSAQAQNIELISEMDTYFSYLGYHPNREPTINSEVHNSTTAAALVATTVGAVLPAIGDMSMLLENPNLNPGREQNSQLGNWFPLSQQMMTLLDNDPFFESPGA
ncbi:unnamed protein product [Clonostachys byssicola]|uniref:Uncharacterized protein n=1 Tax=Clonostachys byssicola TaxID=160290 RepID=A0A9N9UWG9_9HYPO|nr:unnamed protein product [Clonostachys byssicola]